MRGREEREEEGGGGRRDRRPWRRARRRGAGGGLPPSRLTRSRPPCKPLSPPRPQARGASCQAERARRGGGGGRLGRGRGGRADSSGSGHREGGREPRRGRGVSSPRHPPRLPRSRPRPEGSARTRPGGGLGGGGGGVGGKDEISRPWGSLGEGRARRPGGKAPRTGKMEEAAAAEGWGPSPPPAGSPWPGPPAALGSREGGRNASHKALISPPSPVPGMLRQRPFLILTGSRPRSALPALPCLQPQFPSW